MHTMNISTNRNTNEWVGVLILGLVLAIFLGIQLVPQTVQGSHNSWIGGCADPGCTAEAEAAAAAACAADGGSFSAFYVPGGCEGTVCYGGGGMYACDIPDPGPTCDTNPTMDGCSCTKANSCNSTSGSYSGGTCNAPEPAPCAVCDVNMGAACNTNACGVSGGTIQCDGSCSGGTPVAVDACPVDPGLQCSAGECSAGPSCSTNSCESAANSCGQTAGGTRTTCTDGYDSGCSASPPATVDACPADPGLQCSGPCGGGACVPDTSCAATTCSTTTCSDGCGGSVTGTMACGGGGGGSVSCSPLSQSVSSGANATLTASLSGGATFSAWVDGVGNVVSNANPWTKSYTSSASYRARANDGGTFVYSPLYCQVNISGGGCTDIGPVALTASPNRVKSGVATPVTFTVSVVNASANCTLSGPGIPTQTYVPNSCSVSTTYTRTLTLTEQSTYTLACPGGQTAKAIVNIVPEYQEF